MVSAQKARQKVLRPLRIALARSARLRPPASATAGPQTSRRKTMRPTRRPSAVSSTARAATAGGLVSVRPPDPARIGSPSFALPTPNTNAAETSCESADTTR